MFTFMPLSKIAELMEEHARDTSRRVAQHALAFDFVELIHGQNEANAVSWQHRQLFRPRSSVSEPTPPPRMRSMNPMSWYAHFHNVQADNKAAHATTFANMPSIRMTLPRSLVYNQPFSKVLLHAGMVASKSEGSRLLTHGGAYVWCRPSGVDGEMMDQLTFVPIRNWTADETEKYVVDGLLMLRLGKWKFKAIHVVSDEEFDGMVGQLPEWEQINNLRHLSEEDDHMREVKKEQRRLASQEPKPMSKRKARKEAAQKRGEAQQAIE